MTTAVKATEYLKQVNWKSFIEWLTAEAILCRPQDPVQFSRDLLGAKITERGIHGFNPEQLSTWLRRSYADASALVDENGVINGKSVDTANQSLAEQIDELKRNISDMDELLDASSITYGLDITEAINKIEIESTKILKCDRCLVYTIHDETKLLIAQVDSMGSATTIPIGQGIPGIVTATGTTITTMDPLSDPRFQLSEADRRSGYQVENILCVPIGLQNGAILGAIEVNNKIDGIFTSNDERLVQKLAQYAGAALSNCKTLSTAIVERDRYISILNAAIAIQADMYSNSFVNSFVQQSTVMISADRCVMYMFDPTKKLLFVMQGELNLRVPLDSGFAGHIVAEGKMICVPDAYDSPHFNPASDRKSGYLTKAVLAVPVYSYSSPDVVIGVLVYSNKIVNASSGVAPIAAVFDSNDIYMINTLVALSSSAFYYSTIYQNILKKGRKTGAMNKLDGGDSGDEDDAQEE